MKNISSFLDKFKHLLQNDSDLKKAISLVINQKIKIEIEEKNIEIKNNLIYLKEDAYVKNEIFYKKEEILTEIKNLTGKNIKNIF